MVEVQQLVAVQSEVLSWEVGQAVGGLVLVLQGVALIPEDEAVESAGLLVAVALPLVVSEQLPGLKQD